MDAIPKLLVNLRAFDRSISKIPLSLGRISITILSYDLEEGKNLGWTNENVIATEDTTQKYLALYMLCSESQK